MCSSFISLYALSLGIAQAERENAALVAEKGKREEEALALAVSSFQQEFAADMGALKAGGMPYQVPKSW